MNIRVIAACLLAASLGPVAGAQTFYFTGTGAIPDDTPSNPGCGTPLVLTATSNAANPIQDVVLTIAMSHTFVNDLRIRLSYTPTGSPTATAAWVINRVGWNNDLNGNFTFVAGATPFSTAVGSFGTLSFGAYSPVDNAGGADQVVEFADYFRGKPGAGTWTLTFEDCVFGDFGAVTSASIAVQARSQFCLADFNTDGVINTADLTFFLSSFGRACP
jgi:subtilisin-like proprotein convertase family protein